MVFFPAAKFLAQIQQKILQLATLAPIYLPLTLYYSPQTGYTGYTPLIYVITRYIVIRLSKTGSLLTSNDKE